MGRPRSKMIYDMTTEQLNEALEHFGYPPVRTSYNRLWLLVVMHDSTDETTVLRYFKYAQIVPRDADFLDEISGSESEAEEGGDPPETLGPLDPELRDHEVPDAPQERADGPDGQGPVDLPCIVLTDNEQQTEGRIVQVQADEEDDRGVEI